GQDSEAGVAPSGARPVAQVSSLPVRTLIRLVNVPSNNFAAEMLLKGLGARLGGAGSTGGGAAVVRSTLDDFGVRPRIADGSGLSRANLTTPRQVVRLLERMDGQDVGTSFRSSLATAGRTGTLRRRMRATPASGRCRGKTGTLRGVSALAGYCRTRGGRDVAFAILMNAVNPFGARGVQDRMAAAIARLDADAGSPP
nr:D-alanyl-D-alanine carboxypeptidase/D-alanyl-D-alanine-endopeptidase [Solirubrobacterales bacterium]